MAKSIPPVRSTGDDSSHTVKRRCDRETREWGERLTVEQRIWDLRKRSCRGRPGRSGPSLLGVACRQLGIDVSNQLVLRFRLRCGAAGLGAHQHVCFSGEPQRERSRKVLRLSAAVNLRAGDWDVCGAA
jgi:hypothetical protein